MTENLFRNAQENAQTELVNVLATGNNLRIERIVSHGHRSPDDFWYDQDQAEWVMVLQGSGQVQFEDEVQPRLLNPGDFLMIQAHRRHRVAWTTPTQPTIWLAVFFDG